MSTKINRVVFSAFSGERDNFNRKLLSYHVLENGEILFYYAIPFNGITYGIDTIEHFCERWNIDKEELIKECER